MTVARPLIPSQETQASFATAEADSAEPVILLPPVPPSVENLSTQVKCARLFDELSVSGLCPKWTEFYTSVFARAEFQYGHGRDGWPAVMAAIASGSKLKTCCYRWARPSVQTGKAVTRIFRPPLIVKSEDHRPINWSGVSGVYFWLHGLTDHARVELLAFDEAADAMKYEGSFLEALHSIGLVVYAPDYQGHGLSEGYRGERCTAESMDRLIEDAAWWIDTTIEVESVPPNVPIFVGGISMGGLIAVACLKFLKHRNRVNALTLLAPALSLEGSRKAVSPLLFKIAPFAVHWIPNQRLIKVEMSNLFPALKARVDNDALVYHGRFLPAKFAWELYLAGPKACAATDKATSTALLVIQSTRDTLVDTQGAVDFKNSWSGPSDILLLRDKGWHFLLQEPDCFAQVRSRILTFIAKYL